MNGPNKLDRYIIQGQRSFPRTTIQAYWAHLYVRKKMKCCKYPTRVARRVKIFTVHILTYFTIIFFEFVRAGVRTRELFEFSSIFSHFTTKLQWLRLTNALVKEDPVLGTIKGGEWRQGTPHWDRKSGKLRVAWVTPGNTN